MKTKSLEPEIRSSNDSSRNSDSSENLRIEKKPPLPRNGLQILLFPTLQGSLPNSVTLMNSSHCQNSEIKQWILLTITTTTLPHTLETQGHRKQHPVLNWRRNPPSAPWFSTSHQIPTEMEISIGVMESWVTIWKDSLALQQTNQLPTNSKNLRRDWNSQTLTWTRFLKITKICASRLGISSPR